jgi:hypothetical protein
MQTYASPLALLRKILARGHHPESAMLCFPAAGTPADALNSHWRTPDGESPAILADRSANHTAQQSERGPSRGFGDCLRPRQARPGAYADRFDGHSRRDDAPVFSPDRDATESG